MTIKQPKSIRDILANAHPLDQINREIKKPINQTPRLAVEVSTAPADAFFGSDPFDPSKAMNYAELLDWCSKEGVNPAEATGLAIWTAVKTWASKIDFNEANSALSLFVENAESKFRHNVPPISTTVTMHQVANYVSNLWSAEGRPGFDLHCEKAQQRIIGLRRAANKAARR